MTHYFSTIASTLHPSFPDLHLIKLVNTWLNARLLDAPETPFDMKQIWMVFKIFPNDAKNMKFSFNLLTIFFSFDCYYWSFLRKILFLIFLNWKSSFFWITSSSFWKDWWKMILYVYACHQQLHLMFTSNGIEIIFSISIDDNIKVV